MSFDEVDMMLTEIERKKRRDTWIEFLIEDASILSKAYSELEEAEDTEIYPKTSEKIKELIEKCRDGIASVRYDLRILAKYENADA